MTTMENVAPKKAHHLRTFGLAMLSAWIVVAALYLHFYPLSMYGLYYQGLVQNGLGGGPIPVNTLYTVTPQNFTDPYRSGSNLLTTGANHDTLYTGGWLSLSN